MTLNSIQLNQSFDVPKKKFPVIEGRRQLNKKEGLVQVKIAIGSYQVQKVQVEFITTERAVFEVLGLEHQALASLRRIQRSYESDAIYASVADEEVSAMIPREIDPDATKRDIRRFGLVFFAITIMSAVIDKWLFAAAGAAVSILCVYLQWEVPRYLRRQLSNIKNELVSADW